MKKTFLEAFDLNLFKDKRILIDEDFRNNCDFLILEFVKYMDLNLFTFNNTADHFKKIYQVDNIENTVSSVYEIISSDDIGDLKNLTIDLNNYQIGDDLWIQKNIFKNDHKFKIGVFRSGSAIESNYYDYDFVIKVSGLKSGCSNQIDGVITVFSRDTVYYEFKYKITNGITEYF